jgi:hypothetical protein
VAAARRLNEAGITRWWAQEHAAWTNRGWIDIEALAIQPAPRPHG